MIDVVGVYTSPGEDANQRASQVTDGVLTLFSVPPLSWPDRRRCALSPSLVRSSTRYR